MDKQFSDLIILLASGINQRLMYFDNHPQVKALGRDFCRNLVLYLDQGQADNFHFGIFKGKFIRHGKFLVGPSIAGRSLIRFAEYLQCGGFAFGRGVTPEQAVTFFRVAAEQRDALSSREEGQQMLLQAGLGNVEVLPLMNEAGSSQDQDQDDASAESSENADDNDMMAPDFAPLLQVYQALYDTVSGNYRAIHGDTRLDLENARKQGQDLVQISDQGALDVMQFMRYPDYDSYTIGHSVRVAALASLVGRHLGWPAEKRSDIATAGLLHDLGKGKIPEEILFKPGKLDQDERRIMDTHSALSAKLLMMNGEKSSVVLTAAWGHHIRHDGGGYPIMPKGFRNSLAAELIHVCDVFEALTATRPYKQPMPPRRAYEIMLKDTGAFHPRLLAALIRSMGLYPPGSEVILSDQRLAVVVTVGKDMETPMVRLTADAQGYPLPRTEQHALQIGPSTGLTVDRILSMGLEDQATVLN